MAYACDFETRNENPASVWHWGVAEIGNEANFKWGTKLDDFMEWASGINDTLYFHNLAFDGQFIVSWLLNNGFTYNPKRKAIKGTFKTLISKMNQWYSIEICFEDKPKRRMITKIFDSFKKLPFKLSKIAKDYGLPISKGEIDYNKQRPLDYIPTVEEQDYLEKDVKILAMALDIQFKHDLKKMTIGSDCIAKYKQSLVPIEDKEDKKKQEKKFRKLFPILDDYIDKMVRKAYKGGWTYLKDSLQERDIKGGVVFDVNSEYPYAMREKLMPYGTPLYFTGKYVENKSYPLYIQHIRVEFILKENHLPMIQIKKSLHFKSNEYLKSSKGMMVDLHLTSVDLQLFFDQYEIIKIEYIQGFMFKGAYGLFDDYIDSNMKDKIEASLNKNEVKRTNSKLLLNNLYGKFGSDPNVTGKHPYLDDDGIVKLALNDDETVDPQYIAVACFTTAYGRDLIIRLSQSNYDRFIYCDTDSIHLIGRETPDNFIPLIDDTKLGYLGKEYEFKKGRYLYQKTYMDELDNGTLIVKGAGMTDEVKANLSFDNFYIGTTVKGSKKSKSVVGGVMIEETTFTIKERFTRF